MRKILTTGTLIIAFLFGVKLLVEEITQLATFIKEGLELKRSWTWGLRYHFKSRWNWVDAISCIMLLVMLPLFHVWATVHHRFETALSVVTAIEAIVATLKIWYFAQPFRQMGALVLMVDNIFRDCIAFLALALIVLFGFGLGLYVLFRHADRSDPNYDAVHDAFGSFPRSLITLFYALLGTFDPEIFYSAGTLFPLVIFIFSAFSVTEMIVLLNLLIAIMGDTFDKVKSTEESHLLMGRAIFIDACEAGLSQREATALNEKIGKYVHVLMPLEEDKDIDPSQQWMGKLQMLMQNFRSTIRETERKLHDLTEGQLQQMSDIASSSSKNIQTIIEAQDLKITEIAETLSKGTTAEQPDIDALLQLRMEQSRQEMETLLNDGLRPIEEKTISSIDALHQRITQQESNTAEVVDGLRDAMTSHASRLEAMESRMEEMDRRHTEQLATILALLQSGQGGGADET